MADTGFLDDFNRADSSTVGGDWTTETAGLAITDNAVGAGDQTFAGDTQLLLLRSLTGVPHSDMDADFGVEAVMAITSDNSSGATRGAIILRSVDTGAQDCYKVRLLTGQSGTANEDVQVLYIIKTNAGTETILTSMTVTDYVNSDGTDVDDWKTVFQKLGARIYDSVEGVVIEAYLNDESRPIMTHTDQNYPLWRGTGYVGFEIYERANLIFLDRFECRGLPGMNLPTDMVPDWEWTFGELKKQSRIMALRDSGASVDEALWGVMVNAAEQELAVSVGRAEWAARTYDFKTMSGHVTYELPPEFYHVDDYIWDVDQEEQLPLQPEDEFRRLVGSDSTGRPYIWRRSGSGRSGGLLLWGWPKADDIYNFRIRGHTRPRRMRNDSDKPWTPQEHCMAVVWCVVKNYSGRDSDRTHIAFARTQWNDWLKGIELENAKKRAIGGIVTTGMMPSGLPDGGLRG